MTQGERVKKIRKDQKLTTEKFGEALGIQRSAVSKIENGRCSLTEANIKAICREFNVDYIWLTTGEGDDPYIDNDIGLKETIDRIMAGENEFHKNLIKFSASRTDEELELLEHLIDEAAKIFKQKKG